MDLYSLGTVPWQDSQTIYHAMAHLGRPGLILVQPASPYICIGYHQDARQEIDLPYLKKAGIPLFRREVGGGAVYLDRGQLFYQFIFQKDDPTLPASRETFYRKFLEPVVQTLRDFNLQAEFKPVNDILVGGKKISGNGAGEIGDCVVLVGNFLIDFNYKSMARVLKVPDEKFRDKVHKTLEQNLTTLNEELGQSPDMESLVDGFISHAGELIGSWTPRTVDAELKAKAEEIRERYSKPDWLFFNDVRQRKMQEVKIAEGISVLHKVVKLPGGLVRLTAVKQNGVLDDVHLSGDFFIYPPGALLKLEQALREIPFNLEEISGTIESFFLSHQIEAPGISPRSLAEVFVE
jgi:lipoate-protein ligase A